MIEDQQHELEKSLKYLLAAPARLVWALVRVASRPAGVAVLVGLISFSAYSAYSANHRLALVEAALGGQDRLKCTRQDTIEKIRPSIVRIVGGAGEGSGFVLQDGIIVTNYHVIADEPSPKVVYSDDKFENGTVFAVDPDSDLALIKVQREHLDLLRWYDGQPQPGEEVLVVGYALGGDISGELTANATTISGRRAIDVDGKPTFLQLDGGVIPGMSGGPIVSRCGEIVGVSDASMHGGDIGLAIAGSYVLQVTEYLLAHPNYDDKAITRVTFAPDKSPVEAVSAYYNYLKARNFQEAYNLLSPRFIGSVSYQDWRDGFSFSLDTTIIDIAEDKKYPGRVLVELGSTDLIEGEFVYRTFEGAWVVKKENGHNKLWESNIKETTELDY